MAKNNKTNAMRILDRYKIQYEVHEYTVVDGKTDGVTVATTVGIDPAIVFKTLVTKGNSGDYYVYVVPVGESLDLKKAAKAAGEKKVEMIAQKDLLKTTGYIHGGCSPIGMKKSFKTFIHLSASHSGRIVCSGGRIGMQVDLLLEDLMKVVDSELVDIVKERKEEVQ